MSNISGRHDKPEYLPSEVTGMNDNEITSALDAAADHDAIARELRQRAGHLLAQAKTNGNARWRPKGIDERTADLLIEMAIGGHEYQGRKYDRA